MALYSELEQQGIWLFRYRGLIPIIFVVFGLWAFVSERMDWIEDRELHAPQWFWWLCFGVSLAGLAIRTHAVGYASPNTSGRNTKGQVADSVNTSGLYSIMRHPLYTGNFLMWLGIALLTCNFWFVAWFIFLYAIYYERIIYAEEQFLIRKFGAAYTDWSQRTPVVLPAFAKYRPPVNPFHWKRALKQEITGLLLLLTIFCALHETSQYIFKRSFVPDADIWTGMFAASLLAYAIVKLVQKRTSLLAG
jgi:protein-S-isoprenylcysteine O-methyltransferase Ste14